MYLVVMSRKFIPYKAEDLKDRPWKKFKLIMEFRLQRCLNKIVVVTFCKLLYNKKK